MKMEINWNKPNDKLPKLGQEVLLLIKKDDKFLIEMGKLDKKYMLDTADCKYRNLKFFDGPECCYFEDKWEDVWSGNEPYSGNLIAWAKIPKIVL